MELLANGLSLHEQFHDSGAFRTAFARIMAMRKIARRYRLELHCQRDLLNRNPIPGVTLQMAIMGFPREERLAALGWLTKMGPFWEDIRRHSADDYLECRDDVVTDTAIGEAAFRNLRGVDCGLVSFSPSEWEFALLVGTGRDLSLRMRREHGLEQKKPKTESVEGIRLFTVEALLRDGLRAGPHEPFWAYRERRDEFERGGRNRERAVGMAGRAVWLRRVG